MIRDQFILDINGELIVDNFAGGGGASTGIELALGRHVDIAINHDPEAVQMHQANHPQTTHHCESVWDVDPVKATGGRPVALAWFSPDCKHFSKAKGGKPREKKIRGLALVALRWVIRLKEATGRGPRVIKLENVEEFQTWGPLLRDGTLNPKCKGQTFRAFVGALRRRGYAVEWRELRACDYGAPTIRKRLFLIARCDGRPIVWPAPTHGDPASKDVKTGRLLPWRTAAECIDWTLPCPSIFERTRPLAEATCRRIARGIMRYVVNCAAPFIVPLTHRDPSDRVTTMGSPLPTVTGANRGEMALVAPCVAGLAHGDHAKGAGTRVHPVSEPIRTIHAGGGNFALASAFLAKHYGGVVGAPVTGPVHTVTATDHHGLVSANLVGVGGRAGQSRPRDAAEPAATVTAKGDTALVAAHLTKFRTGSTGSSAAEPLHTVTAGPKENPAGAPHAMGLVATHLSKLRGTSTAQPSDQPLHTVSAQGNHFAEVRAFLIKYYGNEKEGLNMEAPMHTVTSRDRFGLVTVNGEEYQIADIGLRMLAPRELYRAQGFPESYRIGDNPAQGLTLTKSAQVRMCGNSVCPPLAAALVAANLPELSRWDRKERVA